MSSETLAVVQRFFDLADAGDFVRAVDSLDRDVVWIGTRGGLDENRVVRGRDAALEYIREIQEPWEQLDVEIERMIEIGDRVLVFLRETAQVRHAGLDVHNETAMIFKVRGQRIVEATGYLRRDEALRAAGLTDRSGSSG